VKPSAFLGDALLDVAAGRVPADLAIPDDLDNLLPAEKSAGFADRSPATRGEFR
jgi:hypothetical protein